MTARISSRVKSGCFAIRARIQYACSSNGETLPPLRFGAALPVSMQRRHQRITELTPTLKISATSRRDAPLSTASTARTRKSVEYGLGIFLAPQTNQFFQTRLGRTIWESPRFNVAGKCSSGLRNSNLAEELFTRLAGFINLPSSGKRVGVFRPFLNRCLLLLLRCGHVGNALALSIMSIATKFVSVVYL